PGCAYGNVIAIDREPNAIARGADLARSARDRLALVEDNFSDLQAVVRNCGYEAIDGVVFDLGVSSMQLDEGARGFSFRHEGPLDMRMSRDGPTAAAVVASASERELAAGLAAAERVLKPGGRLVVLSFHSLEDRITKSFLVERSRTRAPSRHRPAPVQQAATFRILTPRPIAPDEAEIRTNPRARSA